MLIQILQELYDGGADYVDISGDNDVDGIPRDTIKLTVKPEYISLDINEEEDNEEQENIIDYRMDFLIDNKNDAPTSLSDDDIEDLI